MSRPTGTLQQTSLNRFTMFYSIFLISSLLSNVQGRYYQPKSLPPTYNPHQARIVKCTGLTLTKVGCYNERKASRTDLPLAVPELLLTAHKSSTKYVGYDRVTFPTYGDFLQRFVCDCANKVKAKGYVYFSLQNYIECWSGKNVANTYNLYKDADGCVRGDKRQCNLHSQGLCAGTGRRHFVYTLTSALPKHSTPVASVLPSTSPSPPVTTISTMVPNGTLTVKCGSVEYKLRKLGCWNERDNSRALPELLLTATNPYDKKFYTGYYLETKDYGKFLHRFMCDCVSKVKRKGYSLFGLQSYGQCWSGLSVGCSYKKFGKAGHCINQKKWICSDDSSMLCSSPDAKANFVYVLAGSHPGACPTTPPPLGETPTPSVTTTTAVVPSGPPTLQCGKVQYKLKKLGCWSEHGDRPPRAVPDFLLTARDNMSPQYAGYDLDRTNYAAFLQRFVCDCISKVKGKGYSVFGLRYYAECWSGPKVGCTYKKYGKVDGCLNENLKPCSDNSSRLCSGEIAEHVYVYVPTDSPGGATCPTTPPTDAITFPKTPSLSVTTAATAPPLGPPTVQCGSVKYKLTKLGCWSELGDTKPPRAISELLLTAKDKKSSVYVGYEFHKFQYDHFLKRFVCDCVSKVTQKGYSVFGIQFYGECWSGPAVGCTYKKFGRVDGCVNERLAPCSDDSSFLCSGHSSQNVYVYVPASSPVGATCPTTSPSDTTTPTKKQTPSPSASTVTPPPVGPPTTDCGSVKYTLKKLGCWNELGDTRPPRAIPELLLTARDKRSKVYAGYDINRRNFDSFLQRFVCDCISAVNKKGYSIFGIQFYGECWSGPQVECTYKKFGKIDGCVNEMMNRCSDDSSMLCSGDTPTHTYVYVRSDIPLPTCTTTPTSPTVTTISTTSTPPTTAPTTSTVPSPITSDTSPSTPPTSPQTQTTSPTTQTTPSTTPTTSPTTPSTALTTVTTPPTTPTTSPTTPSTAPTTLTTPPTTPTTSPTTPSTALTTVTTPPTTPTTAPTTVTTPPTTPTTPLTTPNTTPVTSTTSDRTPSTSPTTPSTPPRTPTTPSTTPTETSTIPPSTPVTTPTPSIPLKFECRKTLDIVIAVDSSGSVMDVPFQRIKTFISRLTTRFASNPPTYFAILYYNYQVVISARLDEQFTNSSRLRNRLTDMRYLGQATLTQEALKSAETLFDDGGRSDSNITKILILFTDGRTYGGKQTLREPLENLRKANVTVKVVAEGPEDYLDIFSLRLIAGNESHLVITPPLEELSLEEIEKQLDRVTFMVCPK